MARFSVVKKTQKVEMEFAEGVKEFTLVELSGKQRDSFMTAMHSRMKFENGKAVGMSNFDGWHASLLCMVLQDETGKLVKQEEIQSWPAATVAALFEIAQTMNALTETAQTEVKND